jgi:exopolysaccharide biosynthesis polyprenyl glycosylphosphotransferase
LRVSFFSSLQYLLTRLITDIILFPVIIVSAYALKFKIGWIFRNFFSVEFGSLYSHAKLAPYLSIVSILILVWIPTFYFVGMYRRDMTLMQDVDECIKVFKGMTIAMIELLAITFVVPFFPGSRFFVFYTWMFGIIFLIVSRLIILRIETYFLKKGIGVRPVLVIGSNSFGQDVVERIHFYPTLGLYYVGSLDLTRPEKVHFHLQETFNYLGHPSEFKRIVDEKNIDLIFVTQRDLPEAFFTDLVIFCDSRNIELRILSDMTDFMAGTVNVESFDGLPFLTHLKRPVFQVGLILKRIFDIVFSIILLITLAPLFLVVAILIKTSSPGGPVFYMQERVGQNGNLFKMIKFRTMIPNAECGIGPTLVNETNETRYITYGKFLRQMSLDELPQLINVLFGQMSIVGPRPERPFFVEKYTADVPYFSIRHRVKGGITGWAQVNGRSVLTRRPDHKLKYDLYYINNWSFGLDIKILLKTLLVVFKKEEAY